MKRSALLLVSTIAIAIALRFYAVLQLPFEQDELYTIHESTALFDSKLNPGIQARPLFFLLMHPVVANFPHSPIVVRALGLLFGLAGVVATWALARKIAGADAAIVATILVALSPWHIGVSSFARYYSLLYFLATLVFLFFPQALDSDRPRDYLVTLVALLAGTFTHPSFVFPVGAACLVLMTWRSDGTLSWRWPTRHGWMFLWVPFLILFAACYAIIRSMTHATTVGNGSWRGLLSSLRLIPAIVDWISPVLFIAGAAGMFALISWPRVESNSTEPVGLKRFGMMCIASVVATSLALLMLSFYTAIYADYAVAALPVVFVAAASLVRWLELGADPARRIAVATAITGIMLGGLLPSTVSFLSDGSRFDYRPAFARIAKEAPALAVMTWPVAIQKAYAPQLRSYELPNSPAQLNTLLEKEGDIWAVISVKRYGIVGDDDGEVAAWLSDRCRIVDQYQRARLDYRMYRVDLWRCRATRSAASGTSQ